MFREWDEACSYSKHYVRRNLEVSDECKASANNDLTQSLGQGDAQKGEATLAKFPEAYRTRKERKLPLGSDAHAYEKPGRYRILVKVIDIFGNDTSQAFDVEVK